jgi:hypothetical protein
MNEALQSDHPAPRETIGSLLKKKSRPPNVNKIEGFISLVRSITDRWQEADWLDYERDPDFLFNDARISYRRTGLTMMREMMRDR